MTLYTTVIYYSVTADGEQRSVCLYTLQTIRIAERIRRLKCFYDRLRCGWNVSSVPTSRPASVCIRIKRLVYNS